MSDRELLEMAAKAAGVNGEYRTENLCVGGDWMDVTAIFLDDDMGWWNPLTDDGDALRLFTTLPFRELYVSEIGVTVSWRRDGSVHGVKCDEYASEHGGDLNAATRRAIVRAAYEIGKAMP